MRCIWSGMKIQGCVFPGDTFNMNDLLRGVWKVDAASGNIFCGVLLCMNYFIKKYYKIYRLMWGTVRYEWRLRKVCRKGVIMHLFYFPVSTHEASLSCAQMKVHLKSACQHWSGGPALCAIWHNLAKEVQLWPRSHPFTMLQS